MVRPEDDKFLKERHITKQHVFERGFSDIQREIDGFGYQHLQNNIEEYQKNLIELQTKYEILKKQLTGVVRNDKK